MAINILQGLIGGLIATVVWFFIGAVLYMNPFAAKWYKKYEDDPSVKNRKDMKSFLINTFVFSILIQCVIFAFAYQYIETLLPGTVLMNVLYFGIILVGIKIIPRFLDMWVQSKYPPVLLTIELINGAIGSFVIAIVFALLL